MSIGLWRGRLHHCPMEFERPDLGTGRQRNAAANTEYSVVRLTAACIIRARVGTLISRGNLRARREPNETNSQGFVPDASVREHIRSSRRPKSSRSGRWTATVVPTSQRTTLQPELENNKVTKVTS